jgi:hypothetical protein
MSKKGGDAVVVSLFLTGGNLNSCRLAVVLAFFLLLFVWCMEEEISFFLSLSLPPSVFSIRVCLRDCSLAWLAGWRSQWVTPESVLAA